nr:MAG TPA: hypothetical protein [Bacteriophage sp.]
MIKNKNPGKIRGFIGSEGRIRTNDTRIMIIPIYVEY